MQKEILNEITELKKLLAAVIGTSDLKPGEQFSKEALDKAAKEFQKLSIERGDWIPDSDIPKYIKKARYHSGKFIINNFGFTNYFKRGQTYYFNKKDVVALDKELKERNIDLGRYMEYIEDLTKFKKYISDANANNKSNKKVKAFKLPSGLKDITSPPIKMHSPEIIKTDLAKLKEDFYQNKLADYIDIYNKNHAMMKFIYHFEKYIDPIVKRKCKKWCNDFNYANNALQEVTKKKEVFIPVRNEDMIEL